MCCQFFEDFFPPTLVACICKCALTNSVERCSVLVFNVIPHYRLNTMVCTSAVFFILQWQKVFSWNYFFFFDNFFSLNNSPSISPCYFIYSFVCCNSIFIISLISHNFGKDLFKIKMHRKRHWGKTERTAAISRSKNNRMT